MPYVQRDQAGEVVGLFANPIPDAAVHEWLDDDDPEVATYRDGRYWAKRRSEYPAVGDQLGALVAWVDRVRQAAAAAAAAATLDEVKQALSAVCEVPAELDAIVDQVNAVKDRYPPPGA